MGLQYRLFKPCHVTIKIKSCVPTRHRGLDKFIIVDTIHLLNNHFSNHSTQISRKTIQF